MENFRIWSCFVEATVIFDVTLSFFCSVLSSVAFSHSRDKTYKMIDSLLRLSFVKRLSDNDCTGDVISVWYSCSVQNVSSTDRCCFTMNAIISHTYTLTRPTLMTMWKLVRVWIVGSCWDLKFCQFCVRYVVCVNDKIFTFRHSYSWSISSSQPRVHSFWRHRWSIVSRIDDLWIPLEESWNVFSLQSSS